MVPNKFATFFKVVVLTGALLTLGLYLGYADKTEAGVKYPVTALIGTGDINSDQILDDTIVGADLYEDADFYIGRLISASTTLSSMFGGNVLLATSTGSVSIGDATTNNTIVSLLGDSAKLGIGTSSPAAALDIYGDGLNTGGISFGAGPGSNPAYIWYGGNELVSQVAENGRFEFWYDAGGVNEVDLLYMDKETVYFDNLGLTAENAGPSFGINTTWNTTAAATGISFAVANTASDAASKVIDLSVDSNSVFNVGVDGTVYTPTALGVATTSPAQELSVDGDMYVTGSIYFGDGSTQSSSAEKIYAFASSSVLQASADTERSTNENAYTKVKDIEVRRGGSVRVDFDCKDNQGASNSKCQIYVNGVAAGTERTPSSATYVTYSQEISVAAYDNVQLYYKNPSGDGGAMVYARNFRIYYTQVSVDGTSVAQD